MNEINKRIADAIAAKGMKKSEVARRINVSPAFISQLCSGAALPSERTIVDIASVCSVNDIWLRSGEGEMLQAMNEDEELAAYLGDVMHDEPESFLRRLTLEMKNWTPEVWQMLEEICKRLSTEKPDTE